MPGISERSYMMNIIQTGNLTSHKINIQDVEAIENI